MTFIASDQQVACDDVGSRLEAETRSLCREREQEIGDTIKLMQDLDRDVGDPWSILYWSMPPPTATRPLSKWKDVTSQS